MKVVTSWAIQLGVVIIPRAARPEHIDNNAEMLPDVADIAAPRTLGEVYYLRDLFCIFYDFHQDKPICTPSVVMLIEPVYKYFV